ncbi:phage/plasmid primase, P4 family [Streptomyces xinghaiensis]|uniref:DNA primase family protein n=1 Tax=Streptomyces xinghaiensis TaxID=1038928 RepID=UPI00378B5ED5
MEKSTGSSQTLRFGVDESVPTIVVCECTKKTASELHPGLGRVTHRFQYRNPATARVLFSRFRHEPPGEDKTYRYCPCYAKFAQDGPNEWAALLYGAHRVAEKVSAGVERIHLTEGEKDSEAVWKHLHECATTGHQGRTFTVEMAEPLRDIPGELWVHVDRDHLNPKHQGQDSPGAVSALRRVRALRAVGVLSSRIRIVEAAEGKDVEDHFAAGLGVEDFKHITLTDLQARAPREGKRSGARTLTKLPGSELPEGPVLKRVIEAALDRGFLVEPLSNGEYKTSCPNPDHPDGNPSFEFRQVEDKVVGVCRSRECASKEWVRGLGLREADLFDQPKSNAEGALTFPPTDYGNAERLVSAHGKNLRYVPAFGRWLVWDGRRWSEDDRGQVMRRAKRIARGIGEQAHSMTDPDERKKVLSWAARSESVGKLKAMVELAQTEPDIPMLPCEFDRDPMILNCLNGMLDLRTGELTSHDREAYCRRMAPVEYDPAATAPVFEAFLERVVPDTSVRGFLQRAVGYSLTGSNAEQVLLLLHGFGANGKSTFVELMRDMLGDYARQLPPESLMAKQQGGIPNDIAALEGARFVAAAEFDDSARMNERLIKQLTGGESIPARFLHKEWFEFRPQCTIWVSSNHKPVIRGTDDGIWRRFLLVPFEVQIPRDERDGSLPEKLRKEAPGVLNWAVAGAVEWSRNGLQIPGTLRAASDQYRNDSDVLGAFLEDRTVAGPDRDVTKDLLYQEYKHWCEQEGLKAATKIAFGRLIKERGFTDERRGKNKVHFWQGIGLASNEARAGNRLRLVPSVAG